MRNNRGQALIEFILIIPVFLWILFAIIDFGNIIYQKYKLENSIDSIASFYLLEDTNKIDEYLKDIDARISYEQDDNYITIKLEKDIDINTILLNNILGSKYTIETSKVIYIDDK